MRVTYAHWKSFEKIYKYSESFIVLQIDRDVEESCCSLAVVCIPIDRTL